MPVLTLPPRSSLEATSGGFFFFPGLTLFAWPITFLQLTCISRFFKQTAPENYFSPNMLFSFMTQQLLCKYQVTSTPWYIPVFAFRHFFCLKKKIIKLVLLKCNPFCTIDSLAVWLENDVFFFSFFRWCAQRLHSRSAIRSELSFSSVQ